MSSDASTIVYLLFLLVVIGLVVKLGRLFVSLALLGIATVFAIFASLIAIDFIVGGTALQQITNALVPFVATAIAAIVSWLRLKKITPEPSKYD